MAGWKNTWGKERIKVKIAEPLMARQIGKGLSFTTGNKTGSSPYAATHQSGYCL